MSDQWFFRGTLSAATLIILTSFGCEALQKAGVPGMEGYVKPDPVALETEKNRRDQFALHRDHKAFYWLLSHRISNGMQLNEVEGVLGEPGESTTEFSNVKSDGLHHSTDPAFKWGPDNTGRSVVIFFRDGRVANFDPKDYRESPPATSE